MSKNILTVNSGSSSLKFSCFSQELNLVFKGGFERIGLPGTLCEISLQKDKIIFDSTMSHQQCFEFLMNYLKDYHISIDSVGHRVVHGGEVFHCPVVVTAENLALMEDFVQLAPLHQPHNLAGIHAVRDFDATIAQVAVFDTSFHTSIPKINQMLPLDKSLFEQGIKAYGFHGISYDYISRQEALHPYEKTVVAHLGNGSSLCALLNGKSHATTMGFTALDGLMMGSRCGSLDPGVVLHLLDSGMSSKEVKELLYKKSGLLGVSGTSSDLRDLCEASLNGNQDATLALEMYADKAAGHIARLATLLRGIDCLVFTAGIGENSSFMRQIICERLQFMGIEVDSAKNHLPSRQARAINAQGSRVDIFVIPTNEELMIAQATAKLLHL